ncbi:MAG TPA: hypothetical protein VF466_02220 [Candidatus Saccharimonadales bacterium]
MAEDFPSYRHEESDDDEPVEERRAEHAPPPPTPAEQYKEPSEQEGTIFSRDTIAPNLSRPLFDFIRKQEQPEARQEEPERLPEQLPSVSAPGEPETRTYQPPVEAEVAQTIHQAAAEKDDDDDEEEDSSDDRRSSAQQTTAAPAAQPQQPHELQRPLNEQFEEIMRTEMGEDFSRLASGDTLGEDTETEEPEPPRAFIPEWPTPVIPELPRDEAAAEAAESGEAPEEAEEVTEAEAAAEGEPLVNPAGAEAFYYNEDPDEPAPSTVVAAATGIPLTGAGGTGGGMPLTPGPGGPGAPGGNGGGMVPPTNFNNMNMPPMGPGFGFNTFNGAPNYAPNPVMNVTNVEVRPRQEVIHKGRWFVAGFLTGWLVKQHLANKKMARQEAVHQRATEKQNEQIHTLEYNQYHTEQKLKRTQAELQENQTQQAARAARAEQAAKLTQQQQAERPVLPAAEAPAAAVAAGPAAERQPETAPPRAAQQLRETPLDRPPAYETPLQYAAAAAELPFAGRSATGETRGTAPFIAEARPNAAPAAERAPQTPEQAAQEAVAKAYELQPGQHIERAAGGGHDIVVDRHGHEVHGAVDYKGEFQSQLRRNQVNEDVFAATNDNNRPTPNPYDGGIITGLKDAGAGLGYDPAAAGQAASGKYSVGQARQRLQRGKKQNPVIATMASPWLWASVIVLLVAFFVAAFI